MYEMYFVYQRGPMDEKTRRCRETEEDLIKQQEEEQRRKEALGKGN